MTKEEVLKDLLSAKHSEDITRDNLVAYARYFGEYDDEKRRRIFPKDVMSYIGFALNREFIKFYNLVDKGYDNIEFPTGGVWKRNRKSGKYKLYNEIVKDGLPVSEYKKMIKDLIGIEFKETQFDKNVAEQQDDVPF